MSSAPAKTIIRCAIYTRKSSEEGLDQEFNSLDAQYEACSAYIASQKHEGWKRLPDRFDDGGISGGTLERPALQRLMAEIDAGRIDMVVVYKIDRLTRALADFVRLVERLDAKGCSFVSVTQAFNTSTSMGRLTLNVLLSFAQFEREVTAERIRDKIAASKKKGLWMGGIAPLGYSRHPDPLRREFPQVRALLLVVRDLERRRDDQLHLAGRQQPTPRREPLVRSLEQLAVNGDRHQITPATASHTASTHDAPASSAGANSVPTAMQRVMNRASARVMAWSPWRWRRRSWRGRPAASSAGHRRGSRHPRPGP
jgi:DNA invertase Pin-like site-specific DNA recombinase